MGIQQIFFLIVLILVAFVGGKMYGRLFRNIRLGKNWTPEGTEGERWKQMALIALGQKKMF